MRRVDAERSLRRSIALQKSAVSVLGHGGGGELNGVGERGEAPHRSGSGGGVAAASSEYFEKDRVKDKSFEGCTVFPTDSLVSLGSSDGSSVEHGHHRGMVAYDRDNGASLTGDGDDSVMSGSVNSRLSYRSALDGAQRQENRDKQPKKKKWGKQQRQRRLKKPFSADSLLNCLLDLEYGNTDVKRVLAGDNAFQWDIKEYMESLER